MMLFFTESSGLMYDFIPQRLVIVKLFIYVVIKIMFQIYKRVYVMYYIIFFLRILVTYQVHYLRECQISIASQKYHSSWVENLWRPNGSDDGISIWCLHIRTPTCIDKFFRIFVHFQICIRNTNGWWWNGTLRKYFKSGIVYAKSKKYAIPLFYIDNTILYNV